MKDLDFDELDRAVNTLMGSVEKKDESAPDETKVVSITPTLPPTEDPAPVATPSLTTPPAARRSGRFMDVVHSSSDMKKEKPMSLPISRQGTTIEPTKPGIVPQEVKPSAPAVSTSEPDPASDSTPSFKEDTPSSTHSDWPDPLDMSGFKDDESTEATRTEEEFVTTPDSTLETETSSAPSVSEDLEPLSSPFLADAKVKKRPLGGATPTEEVPEPDHTPVLPNADAMGTINDPADQLPPSIEETKKELPPEYQGDLVAIESGSTESSVPTKAEMPDEKKEDSTVSQKTEAPHPTALLEAKTDSDSAMTGPTSIVQQYKEEPSTGDQHNGAIYDTESYHKPLAHPTKKKSGWMAVLWILIILLIGVGAGAALYFLGIF